LLELSIRNGHISQVYVAAIHSVGKLTDNCLV